MICFTYFMVRYTLSTDTYLTFVIMLSYDSWFTPLLYFTYFHDEKVKQSISFKMLRCLLFVYRREVFLSHNG